MPVKKNEDCYYFYYSTCAKGMNCPFRHEPLALGSETTCSDWKAGRCALERCHLRHSDVTQKKDRKAIQCYWENQPTGCRKPHCVFMHKKQRDYMEKAKEALIRSLAPGAAQHQIMYNNPPSAPMQN